MRNVLEEFLKTHHGQRMPTILGLREHIFTGRLVFDKYVSQCWNNICLVSYFHVLTFLSNYSVSSLAWFMSNQETSFVTIGQRILANPLR